MLSADKLKTAEFSLVQGKVGYFGWDGARITVLPMFQREMHDTHVIKG